jgi:dihydroorotate dehydrogenase electron transfer subunit
MARVGRTKEVPVRLGSAELIDRDRPWPSAERLSLHLPDVPQIGPGQYALIMPEGRRDPVLPWPLLPSAYDPRTRTAEILIPEQAASEATAPRWYVGEPLRALAPLGRPFEVASRTRRAVLVGTDAGLGPLRFLARLLVADGLEVTMVVLYDRKDRAMPGALLPHEVEYVVVEEAPGQADALGVAIDPLITWADALYLALPMRRLHAVLAVLRRRLLRLRKGYAQALLVPVLLPCGVGACDLCAIETRNGARRPCRDGLVFDLLTLI